MSEPSKTTALAFTLLLFLCCIPTMNGSAELTPDERLAEQGLTLLALRNDTIDTNQDGDIDAVRVVIVLNSTQFQNEMIVKLRGLHKEREVLVVQELAFESQTNISLVYDSWAAGEHDLRLDFFDRDGDFIATYPLPTFLLRPALQVPLVHLDLDAGQSIQTGETCTINRDFSDETGPRYGETGVRTFTGAPFSVLDTQQSLDCSSWPAGDYELKETYRNGLGQTTESSLNFTIFNRPPPDFALKVMGHQNTTDTPCSVMIESEQSMDYSSMAKVWSVQGTVISGVNSSSFDCSNLGPGAHLVTLEIITEKMISSTQGTNLIRLPSLELMENESASLPSTSLGPETETTSVCWISIGILALVVTVLVFLMLVRIREPEQLELPNLGPEPQILADGSPDPQGLPTTVDDQGMLWRQHPDGSVDWWDQDWRIWHKW